MRNVFIRVVVLAVVVAACSSEQASDPVETTTTTPSTTAAPTTTAVPTTTAAPTTTVAPATETTSTTEAEAAVVVAGSDLGEILTDDSGFTLYLFIPDDQGASVCYDQCEASWPPLVASTSAGEGVDATLLSTAPRTDGSSQATYNGWPLYYFANDLEAGETNGQGLNDVWYVVDVSGEPIR